MFAKSIVLLIFCHIMSCIYILIYTLEDENWFRYYSDDFNTWAETDNLAKYSLSW